VISPIIRVLCTVAGVAGFLGGLAPSAAQAGDAVIEFFTASFLPQSVTVEIGESVTFQWRRGEHTVTSGTGPDDPRAGELFDTVLDEEHPAFELAVTEPRPAGIPFFDRRHPGQQGFIDVSAGEETFRVGVVDNVYIPDESWIFAGDSIRWEHEPDEMFHTVTSGTGNADPGAGELFDAESSNARPIFVHQFLTADVYPYFCRPHERLGMIGTVYVQELFVRGDATGEGAVDISDPVATLNYLFLGAERRACEDALDANDDGAVDIGDAIFALGHLFLGTEAMPPPYPFAGGDRTDDALRCLPAGAV